MTQFDFNPIEKAVGMLKVNYPAIMFAIFCEQTESGTRGIVDMGVGSRAKGLSKHTIIVPVEGVSDANGYYKYLRDMLIKAGCLPSLINTTITVRRNV
jgi:hypothetical protein